MSLKKVNPGYLKPGDEVAIVSPSFYIDEDKIAFAESILKQWGLRVRIGENALHREGPFAGSDKDRLNDLQEMTDDSGIKAVLCSRGGYGMSRIIGSVDFSALKINPKWYVGFSDITVLHMWLSEVCGIASIHGEMPLNYNTHAGSEYVIRTLQQALFGEYKPIIWEGTIINSGNAGGELTGGNLSLLYSLIGTPAEPDTKGKILFIEEIGEYYYHLDRMLTSLKLAGKLDSLSAILVGGMNDIKETKMPWIKGIEETISEVVREYNYPLFFNFPAGHIDDNRAFYIGRQAKIEIKGRNAILTYI